MSNAREVDYDQWWDDQSPDEQDATLSSALTGNSDDFSWLDEDDDA